MKSIRKAIRKPSWRIFTLLAGILLAGSLLYLLWTPGKPTTDGRYDRTSNGIWIQHGWLGDDDWFSKYGKEPGRFRNRQAVKELVAQLKQHGITFVYPHLCPGDIRGHVAGSDSGQVELFLDEAHGLNVLPWIGGVRYRHCHPDSKTWRLTFAASAGELLMRHPRLDGVHLNIEPLPSGDPDFLQLLEDLRHAIPAGKRISVAAYPPPTFWQPTDQVHWEKSYFRDVARRTDQMVVMMYDTSIKLEKVYQNTMALWTEKVLLWSGTTPVILGIPAYNDKGVAYHTPRVENIENALYGINRGLSRLPELPKNYQGVALYCEWEMTSSKWETFRKEFSGIRER